MIGRIILLFAVSSLLYSCSVFKPAHSNKAENFDQFYKRFHTDSLFQMSRITFPLEGLPSFAEEAQFTGERFRWQRDDWEQHLLINYDAFPDLSQNLVKEQGQVKESINMGNGFGLERHFALEEGKWFLVFYVGINRIN